MEEISPVFDSLVFNLQLVIDEIEDGKAHIEKVEEFSLEAFWVKMEALVKAVSAGATNLCMAFSELPIPESQEYSPIFHRLEEAGLALVSAYFNLPVSKGTTLKKSTRDAIVQTVRAVQALTQTVKTEGCQSSKQQLQKTGSVWECCDNFSSLPRDNKAAVVRKTEESLCLVKDALEEMEQAQNEEDVGGFSGFGCDEEAATWSPADRLALSPALGLVKATKACLKKVGQTVAAKAHCDSVPQNDDLDLLVARLTPVSPAVDDMVSCLYPPLQRGPVRDHAQRLVEVLNALLEYIRHTHVVTDADSSWVEFLLKAVDHNWTKLQAATACGL